MATRQRSPQGRSEVTPIKHDFLDALLGRHAGVLTSANRPVDYELWVDLTAGDGVPVGDRPWVKGCSPGVMLRHAKWANGPIRVVLNEKLDEQISRLRGNVQAYAADADVDLRIVHGEAKDLRLCLPASQRWGVFLYNDPNRLDGWALTPSLYEQCPEFTCTMSTLGCNATGFKAWATREQREYLWDVEVAGITRLVRPWHDVGLFYLRGNDAQWTYLVTTAADWRDRVVKEWKNTVHKWNASTGNTFSPIYSWKRRQNNSGDRDNWEWDALVRHLMYSGKERELFV